MGEVLSCLNSSGRQLLTAAARGNAEAVEEALEGRPELASFTCFSNGYSALHHAAVGGHLQVMQAVVGAIRAAAEAAAKKAGDVAGAQGPVLLWSRFMKDVLNQRSNMGQTPLILACEHGHTACVKYLLQHNADPFVVDKPLRRGPIHYAALHAHIGVLRVLLDEQTRIHTEDGEQPLKFVRIHDMSGMCRYIDSRSENGMTAIHLAALSGSLDVVRVLLDAGASMMVRTVHVDMSTAATVTSGSTPLHLAAQVGSLPIVQAMLQAHADALGTWGRDPEADNARREWEGDGRIDLRSVGNTMRQLPYHIAVSRGFQEASIILNPTVPIAVALENCREAELGYGPQTLATLAAYALRRQLLDWLETCKVEKDCAAAKRARCAADSASELDLPDSGHLVAVAASPPPGGLVTASAPASLATSPAPAPSGMAALAAPAPSPPLIISPFAVAAQGLPALHEASEAEESSASRSDLGESASRQLSNAGASRSLSVADTVAEQQSLGRRKSGRIHPQARASPTAIQNAPSYDVTIADIADAPSDILRALRQQAERAASRPLPIPDNLAAPRRSLAGSEADSMARGPSLATSPDAVAPQPSTSAPIPFLPLRLPSSPPELAASSARPARHGRSISVGEGAHLRGAYSISIAEVSRMDAPYNIASVGSGEWELLSQGSLTGPSGNEPPARSRITSPGERSSRQKREGVLSMRRAHSTLDVLKGRRRRPGVLASLSSRSLGKRAESEALSRSASQADMKRAASIHGFDTDDEEELDCGICLDAEVEVSIAGCCHKLCLECSMSLCKIHKKPPLCPFCRATITGFAKLPRCGY